MERTACELLLVVLFGCCEYKTDIQFSRCTNALKSNEREQIVNCENFIYFPYPKSPFNTHTLTQTADIHSNGKSGICSCIPFLSLFLFDCCCSCCYFFFYASAIIRHMKIRYSTVVSRVT